MSLRDSTEPRQPTNVWALTVILAGIGLYGGFALLFGQWTGRWGLVEPESSLALLLPYVVSALNILLARGRAGIRWLGVGVVWLGLVSAALVLWEVRVAIAANGWPPDMLGAAFLGAVGLMCQYVVTVPTFFWLFLVGPPRRDPDQPPTPEEQDYAD